MLTDVKGTSYGVIRQSHILFNYESSPSALHALLRVEGSEADDTRTRLAALGFQPVAGPSDSSIGWRLHVRAADLADTSMRICKELGDVVILDIGAAFDAHLPISPDEARWWPGQFLVEVGGTRRCVLFDRATDEHALVDAVRLEREDYFANELEPATE